MNSGSAFYYLDVFVLLALIGIHDLFENLLASFYLIIGFGIFVSWIFSTDLTGFQNLLGLCMQKQNIPF